mgnify:FL=1
MILSKYLFLRKFSREFSAKKVLLCGHLTVLIVKKRLFGKVKSQKPPFQVAFSSEKAWNDQEIIEKKCYRRISTL